MSLCPKVCVWNYYKLNSLLDSWLCKLPVSSRINFTCLHLFTRFSCIKLCLLIITSYRFNICRICRNLASIFSELISYHLFLSTIISTNRVSIFLSSHVNFLYCFPVLQFHSNNKCVDIYYIFSISFWFLHHRELSVIILLSKTSTTHKISTLIPRLTNGQTKLLERWVNGFEQKYHILQKVKETDIRHDLLKNCIEVD